MEYSPENFTRAFRISENGAYSGGISSIRKPKPSEVSAVIISGITNAGEELPSSHRRWRFSRNIAGFFSFFVKYIFSA